MSIFSKTVKGASDVLTGDKKVLKTIAKLTKPTARRRAMMVGLREAAKHGNKYVKNQVSADNKEIRKAMKWRALKTTESKEAAVKFGAGVGKRKVSFKERDGRPGVGISANNIHWWFMGTRKRVTKSGKATGAMTPQEDPVIVMVSPAVPTMLILTREGAKKGLMKELAKAKA